MKRLSIFVFIFLCIALLAACVPEADKKNKNATAEGGVSLTTQYINLKDIDITLENSQTVVTLSLLSGSRRTGYAESKLTQLPKYSVELLGQPQRLKITLDGISFWDYEQKDSWMFSDFAVGLFQEAPAQNDSLIIFIQLTSNADFAVEEKEGSLIVRLTPGAENTDSKFFCIANAFFEHQEGRWPEDSGMMPVLSSDLKNRMLISRPFDSFEEANAHMLRIQQSVSQSLPDKMFSVVELGGAQLPVYPADIDYALLEKAYRDQGRHTFKNQPFAAERKIPRYCCRRPHRFFTKLQAGRTRVGAGQLSYV